MLEGGEYILKCGSGLQLVNHKFGPSNCILKNRLNYTLSNTVTDSHNLTLLICQRSYGNTQSSLTVHQHNLTMTGHS